MHGRGLKLARKWVKGSNTWHHVAKRCAAAPAAKGRGNKVGEFIGEGDQQLTRSFRGIPVSFGVKCWRAALKSSRHRPCSSRCDTQVKQMRSFDDARADAAGGCVSKAVCDCRSRKRHESGVGAAARPLKVAK